MRFVSFEHAGKASFGLLVGNGNGIVDLGSRFQGRFASLKALIAADELDSAREWLSASQDYPADAVNRLPVIPEPMHLWCLAVNYVEHHAEVEAAGRVQDLPKRPALFSRAIDSMVGDGRPLLAPKVSEQFDYEGELAVIIGKPGRHIAEQDAMDHVAGYSIFNDGSIRDWQFHTRQITPGKNFYQTASLGPTMVTADEVADPDNLSVKTWLNDQLVQDGNTRDMLFKIPAFIAYASTVAPLMPGDVLATGTPSGVGFSRKPPLWMKAGDRCTIEIEGLGTLSNPIVAEHWSVSG